MAVILRQEFFRAGIRYSPGETASLDPTMETRLVMQGMADWIEAAVMAPPENAALRTGPLRRKRARPRRKG